MLVLDEMVLVLETLGSIDGVRVRVPLMVSAIEKEPDADRVAKGCRRSSRVTRPTALWLCVGFCFY